MAQGAVTVVLEDTAGCQNVVIGTDELSSTYSAGGVALGTAKFGLTTVNFVEFEPVLLTSTTALVPLYNRATDKIMFVEGDGPTTAGPLIETDEDLTNSPDVRFKAYGHKTTTLS